MIKSFPFGVQYYKVLRCEQPTKEFEALKNDPSIQFPEKHMLQKSRNLGQYQGCFGKSHWGHKRVAHKWDLFCEIAPKQAKIYSEIPNHVRQLLGVPTLKHSNSKFKEADGNHKVPYPLLEAMESILMQRVHLGEEVTHDFACSVLLRLVQVWNEKLQELTSDARLAGQAVVKQQHGNTDHEEAKHMDSLLSHIRECKISTNANALKILGSK